MFLPILAMVIAVISGYLGLIRQYQMLQQNSYFASRYLRWLKGNTPFLPLVLKGCVTWAKENGVELVTEEHMKIINDKRAQEKKKK